jgi:Tfp pilus assembly protein PilX
MANSKKTILSRGVLTVWVLVFGTIFILMLGSVLGFVLFQVRLHQNIKASNLAAQIAEAGINYAKWHLAHNETDYNFNGTYDYYDPEGSIVGQYQLTITAPSGCGAGVTIKSAGWKQGVQGQKRTLQIKYAKPALARYGFLTHTNAWFGENEELKGPFHSNGGIRMDGSQNSLSTSAKQTYICGEENGCTNSSCKAPCLWKTGPHECECPGIWGSGNGGSLGLWQYPASNVDFDAITQDMSTLKTTAKASGIYIASSTVYGYHLIFKDNGTFDLYKVTALQPEVRCSDGTDWFWESNDILTQTFVRNYNFSTSCAPVFIEDNVWVEGTVLGRITVAAARLPDIAGTNAKIIIPNNILYANSASSLGLMAQKDVMIPLRAPDDLSIQAVMLAQKGHVWRYYYPDYGYEPYRTYTQRHRIETYGSIISKDIWTFSWVNNAGNIISGYEETSLNYNSSLTFDPPPYFPVSGDFTTVKWEEIPNN